jgi:hypothetical protein
LIRAARLVVDFRGGHLALVGPTRLGCASTNAHQHPSIRRGDSFAARTDLSFLPIDVCPSRRREHPRSSMKAM